MQGLAGAVGACDAAQHGVGPRAARARPGRARPRPPSSARLPAGRAASGQRRAAPQVPAGADAGGVAQHGAVFKLDRGRLGHAFTVSSVAWYAIDTGLFVSGSFDKTVKVPPRRQPAKQSRQDETQTAQSESTERAR